eukprot:scaffold84968_cov66-Phaeocystis_antarctica.AAC.1
MLDLAHEPLPNSRLGCCIELRYASMLKVTSWQRPSGGTPGGSGRLGTPRERPTLRPSSHCLGCSSEPPPKPLISPPLTMQARARGDGRTDTGRRQQPYGPHPLRVTLLYILVSNLFECTLFEAQSRAHRTRPALVTKCINWYLVVRGFGQRAARARPPARRFLQALPGVQAATRASEPRCGRLWWGMSVSRSPPALVLGGPMFYAHVQQCEAKLTEASAALVTLAEEVTALRAAGAQECEAAVAELLASTGQLQEAFEFVDVLAHNVRAATALVDATERRLDTLEAGLRLPRAIAQLPPVQFEAHQFAQQLQRRECATIPELPELSELASRAERAAQVTPNPNPTLTLTPNPTLSPIPNQADAAELEQLSEYELKLEQMARDVNLPS